jgi:hypothetical protein
MTSGGKSPHGAHPKDFFGHLFAVRVLNAIVPDSVFVQSSFL